MKPVELEFLIKNGTKAALDQIISDITKVGNDGAASVGATTDALNEAQQQIVTLTSLVSHLEDELKRLSSTPADIDQSDNIKQVELLQSKIKELEVYIKQLEETSESTQVVPPSLPTAKKQFNGLHMSIQQMAREMPSLAMGPQMFFLAISNNLPIFTDELARAKKEYTELIATGQKGTPVWKQVATSLFSWQTALTTGIMLLIAYGDEIVNAIRGMVGFNAATKEISESAKKAAEDVEKEHGKIETLTSVINNSNVSYEKRISALNELKSTVPEYNASLTKEGELIDNNTSAIERYLEAFREKIYLKAAEDDLSQAYIDRRKAEQKIEDKIAKGALSYAGGSLSAGNMSYTTVQYSEAEADKMRKDYLKEYDNQIEKLNNEIAEHSKNIESKNSPIYGDLYDNAKDEWEKAKATLAQIEADRHSFTQKQYESAVDAEKIANESFSKLGGNTSVLNKKESTQIIDFETDLINQRYKNKQSEIDLMVDGSDKRIEQIKLNYTKEIAEIESQEKKWREAQNGELNDDQYYELDTARNYAKSQYKKDTNDIYKTEQKEQQKALESVLDTIESYERSRTRIVDEYAQKRKSLYEDESQTILREGATQSDIDWLNDAESADLTSLDLSAAQASSKIKAIWDNTTNIASEALDQIIADAEALYGVLSTQGVEYSSKIGEQFGLTRDQFEALIDKAPELRERIEQLRSQSDQTKTSFEGLSGAWEQMIKGASDGDLNVFKQGLNGLKDKAASAITLADSLADTFASIGDATGNNTWSNVAEGIGQVTSALSETLSMAQAGSAFGPIGAAIGAVIGLASSIAGMFAAAAETRRETARLNDELIKQEYTAQYEINQLYRERYEWAKKIAETELENAQRNILEAEKQLEANKKEQSELLSKLQGEEYITGYHTEKTGLFGWGKGKTVEDRSSLLGKGYDEILELEAEGKLTPEAQAYLDQLKELYDEEGELAQRLEDARVAQQELWAGLSIDDAVNTAMDDLLDGTISAAEAYDKIMQGAAKNMLKELMSKETQEWYKGFAAAGEGGYTNEEREYWKKRWEKLQADNAQRKEDIEQTTGVNLDTSSSQSGRSGSFETLSQEQGTKLEGLFTAAEIHLDSIDDYVVDIKNDIEDVSMQLSSVTGYLKTIAENTGGSKDILIVLYDAIKKMINDGLKVK